MATVNLANVLSAGTSPSQDANVKKAYQFWVEIDLAEAAASKGSALAQGDVIEALRVPPNTLVEFVWAKKVSAMTGTSTDLTFDIGFTGGDVDNYVDGWDFDGAAVGSYSTPLGVQEPVIVSTSDTIDILFVTQTGTVTGGKLIVGAQLVDIDYTAARGGIAQPKS